jgi:hypothetical protein
MLLSRKRQRPHLLTALGWCAVFAALAIAVGAALAFVD